MRYLYRCHWFLFTYNFLFACELKVIYRKFHSFTFILHVWSQFSTCAHLRSIRFFNIISNVSEGCSGDKPVNREFQYIYKKYREGSTTLLWGTPTLFISWRSFQIGIMQAPFRTLLMLCAKYYCRVPFRIFVDMSICSSTNFVELIIYCDAYGRFPEDSSRITDVTIFR